MNRFEQAQVALNTRMKATNGRTVTYTRKSDGLTVALTMWPGNTLYSTNQPEPGANVIWGDRDYLCVAAELKIAGVVFTPAKGDRIADVDPAGNAIVFELQTPTGEPVWRYSDQTRLTIRTHCKRVT